MLLLWSLRLHLTALYSFVCMAPFLHACYRQHVHVAASHSFGFSFVEKMKGPGPKMIQETLLICYLA
jgi:hypothetical protein